MQLHGEIIQRRRGAAWPLVNARTLIINNDDKEFVVFIVFFFLRESSITQLIVFSCILPF